MTAQQAIERANEMKAGNAVPDELKLEWLTELDGMIYKDCVLTHLHDFRFSRWWTKDEDGKWIFKAAPKYTQDNSDETLIVDAPDEAVYIYWLISKIDLFSQEEHRYNVDFAQFEDAFRVFKARYHRTHTPVPNPSIKVGVFR